MRGRQTNSTALRFISSCTVTYFCVVAIDLLASSVIKACENPNVIDIGLPLELSAAQYAELQSHAVARLTMTSEIDHEHRIVVTVFDVKDQSVLECYL